MQMIVISGAQRYKKDMSCLFLYKRPKGDKVVGMVIIFTKMSKRKDCFDQTCCNWNQLPRMMLVILSHAVSHFNLLTLRLSLAYN
jgi:hypothetical protein